MRWRARGYLYLIRCKSTRPNQFFRFSIYIEKENSACIARALLGLHYKRRRLLHPSNLIHEAPVPILNFWRYARWNLLHSFLKIAEGNLFCVDVSFQSVHGGLSAYG